MTLPSIDADQRVGIVFTLIAAASFATWTVLTKLAFRHGVEVPLLIVARFVVGTVSIWAVVWILRIPGRPTGPEAVKLWALGVSFVLFTSSMSLSIERIPAATASLLLYTHPPMVATFGAVFGRERWSVIGTAGLALSLTGTVLVLGAPEGATHVVGILFGLTAALLLATNIIVIDAIAGDLNPFVSSAYVMTGGAVASAVFALLPRGLDLRVSAIGWAIVIGLAVISTLVAFTAKMVSIEKLGPTKAAIGNTLEPVFTLLLAVLFLSENLGPIQLVGASLVVLAVGILPLKRRADDVAAAPAPIK